MGSILVGYDGSESAKKALEKAVTLIKENDELIVVSVVPSFDGREFTIIDSELSAANAQSKVNSAIAGLKEKGINIIGIVREGDIADEILKIGKEMKCDLIVIGHKGVSKIGKFMLGSVAEKVVRYASRPVLVVR
ncbi:MAG: universal stress protein [Candidatus Thermoplasmatota archaeon]|nr:universal stress protein [Candidatus Thermoplasmatota archaeon]MCG2825285.1 universal stress protein [Thermoplasmatales archaeon]